MLDLSHDQELCIALDENVRQLSAGIDFTELLTLEICAQIPTACYTDHLTKELLLLQLRAS